MDEFKSMRQVIPSSVKFKLEGKDKGGGFLKLMALQPRLTFDGVEPGAID
jgi:hypothetical protein